MTLQLTADKNGDRCPRRPYCDWRACVPKLPVSQVTHKYVPLILERCAACVVSLDRLHELIRRRVAAGFGRAA